MGLQTWVTSRDPADIQCYTITHDTGSMLDSNATCEKYGYNLTTATVVTNSSRIILQEILSLQPYDSHLDAFWTGIYQQGKQVNKL